MKTDPICLLISFLIITHNVTTLKDQADTSTCSAMNKHSVNYHKKSA